MSTLIDDRHTTNIHSICLFSHLLIRVCKCTARHVASMHGNSLLLSSTLIVKTQFKQGALVVKSPGLRKKFRKNNLFTFNNNFLNYNVIIDL